VIGLSWVGALIALLVAALLVPLHSDNRRRAVEPDLFSAS